MLKAVNSSTGRATPEHADSGAVELAAWLRALRTGVIPCTVDPRWPARLPLHAGGRKTIGTIVYAFEASITETRAAHTFR